MSKVLKLALKRMYQDNFQLLDSFKKATIKLMNVKLRKTWLWYAKKAKNLK